ncbi:hypothetical protein OG906_23865 [Streptomyces sp. NBC_01426]|uniref:hypothetical protein n=1 Tax=Streptomyces sp. NBC_01426 TaxID=2975866 RepID=UPI002E31AABD|nr:hypothetical protein [Streptomyces sp. NBC_01426]
MTCSARRAARWPRLPLLAVLLLGIVTMHTWGHPADSHTGEDAPAAHSVARADAGVAHHLASPHTAPGAPPAAGLLTAASLPSVSDLPPAADLPPAGRPQARPAPGPAMDPMSVCLAVLAGLVLLVLGGSARRRPARPEAGPGAAARAPAGPDPPAPRELLRRLAVLRV